MTRHHFFALIPSSGSPQELNLRVFAPSREKCSGARAKSRRREDIDVEPLAAVVVDEAFHLHKDLGPGLLETVYEAVLCKKLSDRGLKVERQKRVPICYEGVELDEGSRLDLLVENSLVLELKSLETLHPVHPKQLLTYLRLMDLPLGLLINFGAVLFKQGVKRVVNQHTETALSELRIHTEQS